MGLLARLGLGPKAPRPVGQNLEKGRPSDKPARKKNAAVKIAIFLGLGIITLIAFPHGDLLRNIVQVGEPWQHETLIAPFDFTIYKDPERLRDEREQVRYRTPPLFRESPGALARIEANRDTVRRQLDRIFETYASYRRLLGRGRENEALRDSLRFQEIRRSARLKLVQSAWQELLEDYMARLPELSANPLEIEEGPRLDERLLNSAWEFSAQLVSLGVMDVPLDSVYADRVIVRNEAERIDRVKDVARADTAGRLQEKTALYGLDEAYDAAHRHFVRTLGNDEGDLAYAFFRAIFSPSLDYLRTETLEAWERETERISPTQGIVQKGEVIARKNEIITPEIQRKILSLQKAESIQGGALIVWKVLIGQVILVFCTYLLFFLYLYLLRRHVFEDNRRILLVALLFAGIIGLFAIALRLPTPAMLAVPVAIASVLLTVIFDSRVGILGTLALALIGGLLLNLDFEYTFVTVFAGTLGVFSVRDIKNRGQFFLSAGLVFLAYVTALFGAWLIYGTPWERFTSELLLVGINSILLIMAYPLLWVFERAFDVTTDLTLLELSDTNRPLLKELGLRAPGTFNHSLQVANLAEAAADSIGANALLTRVGALYHDIGKMLKPEYFVENQRPGANPHDALKPRMSALIIASHVKEGLELGRQYNLPDRVLRFIPMHHGTTRIEYFYRKAEEQRGASDSPVLESEFRYPGPRPSSKEAGILMLADSVEAASRSLADPTHKRLETLIDMIFKARIEDSQLDMTDLTFSDLNQIKETFLSMLLGIYHVRVKYPGQTKERAERALPEPPVPGPSPEVLHDMDTQGIVGIPEQSVAVYRGRNDVDDGPDEDAPEEPPPADEPAPMDLDPERRAQPSGGDGNPGFPELPAERKEPGA